MDTLERLPDDIIQLVADELLAHRDFATLYNLSIVSKRLALHTLPNLYRIYNEATDDDDEAEGFQNAAQQQVYVQRWAVKWRTIILACLSETVFPYHRYMRVLDLRDLSYLLSDQQFRAKTEKTFFSGSLAGLRREREWQPNRNRPARKVLDVEGVVEAAADLLIPASKSVEQLSGPFQADAFLRWIPNLPFLQRLELFIGTSLKGKNIHEAIYENCPKFNGLSIFSWMDPGVVGQLKYDPDEADRELGAFLAGLPFNNLTIFENIRQFGLKDHFCRSLAKHSESLTELRLCIEKDTITHLIWLRRCTKLRRFRLEIAGTIVDENSIEKDCLDELIDWLQECSDLQSVELSDVGFAPHLLIPLCESEDISLEDLDIKALRSWYSMKENRQFHTSLGHQTKLKNLSIFGDATDVSSDDNDTLVESVCQCKQLRRLKLRGVSEYFSEEAVIRLLTVLTDLQEVYIHGLMLGDNVLEAVATHPKLRTICFMDLTVFTFEGLLGFISILDESKQNFELAINMASSDRQLSDEEIQMVRQSLYDKVQGKLDYVPWRDQDASDFSLESD